MAVGTGSDSVLDITKDTKYVGFKTGTQAKLEETFMGTANTATPGCFYLTSDTHRLYVGNNDKTISAVNEGIITVDRVSKLPIISDTDTTQQKAYLGQFYYAAEENILCVFSGQRWVQINQVVDTSVGSNSAETSVTDSTATITTTVTNYSGGQPIAGQSYGASYKISADDGLSISQKTGSTNEIIIGDGRSLSAATNSSSGVDIIYGDGTADHTSSVNIVAKGATNNLNNASVTYEDGKIYIDSKNTYIKDVEFSNHVTNTTTGATQGFDIILTDSDNKTIDTSSTSTKKYLDPTITIGNTSTTAHTKHFVNGEADFTGLVYSKEDIDSLMQGLNAMHYKGTVGTGGTAGSEIIVNSSTVTGIKNVDGTANLTNFEIGDTFLACEQFNLGGALQGVGTLIIAQGTEDATTKYITADTLKFAVVQESHNTDTTYQLEGSEIKNGDAVEGYKIILKEDTGSAVSEAGNISLKGSDYIKVTGSETAVTGNNTETVTITHAASSYSGSPTAAASNPSSSDGVLSAVVLSGITVDSGGHITAAEKQTITFADGGIDSDTFTTKAENNVGTISNTVVYKRGGDASEKSATGEVTISSSTLSVTANAAKTGLVMDMMWGSF